MISYKIFETRLELWHRDTMVIWTERAPGKPVCLLVSCMQNTLWEDSSKSTVNNLSVMNKRLNDTE